MSSVSNSAPKSYRDHAAEFADAAARSMYDGAQVLIAYTWELEEKAKTGTSKAFELALRNVGDALTGSAFFARPQNNADKQYPKYYAAIERAGWMLGVD
jgi:hypothetical protein